MRIMETINRLAICIWFVTLSHPATAAKLDPVQWSLAPAILAPGQAALLKLHAQIEPGYHLYSLTTPDGGPIRTTVNIVLNSALIGRGVYQPNPERQKDATLGVAVELFTGGVDFFLPVQVNRGSAAGTATVMAKVRYQSCSDRICLPPADREAPAQITIQPGAPAQNVQIPRGYRKTAGARAVLTSKGTGFQ